MMTLKIRFTVKVVFIFYQSIILNIQKVLSTFRTAGVVAVATDNLKRWKYVSISNEYLYISTFCGRNLRSLR